MSSNTAIFLLIFLTSFAVREISSQIGSECWDDMMCSYLWGRCRNFACACLEPRIPNAEGNQCVVDLNSRCPTSTDVCLDTNARCRSSWCSCNAGFILNPETSYCVPHLNASCEVGGLECIDGSCIEGTCQCPVGKVPNANLMRCGTDVGYACTSSDDFCVDENAQCVGDNFGVCTCNVNYQALTINGAPLCKKVLGAECTTSSLCADEHAFCEQLNHGFSTCNCQYGYVPTENRSSCLPIVTHWPGSCQEDAQCSGMYGRYSECQNNVCGCITGYTYEKNEFGCAPTHAAGIIRAYEGIELLTKTLLSYLPSEAQTIAEDALQALTEARSQLEI